MSNRFTRCGVYSITAPDGKKYIGASSKIERRWHEHRSTLRHGIHHSERLQSAWDYYAGNLVFDVLEECDSNYLPILEQAWIDRIGAELNMTTIVGNVYADYEVREKLKKIHSTSQWKESRAFIAANSQSRWIGVDCSDGRQFKKMADAARAFSVRISSIKHLALTQRIGRLGVRIKFSSDEWRDVLSATEQRIATMRVRGTNIRTAESREKMNASANEAARLAA